MDAPAALKLSSEIIMKEADKTPDLRTRWGLVACVLALTFAAYCGTLLFDFAYDDHGQILNNPHIQSWKYWTQYFTTDVSSHASKWVQWNYYRPLFLLWFRINDSIFKLHPMGWHLTTVAIHLAVTFAVYRLALKVAKDQMTAAVAALIFGIHPVHVESVAWISGITDPLMALFLIPSLNCYINWRGGGKRRPLWFVLSLVLYALTMLAKETGLILPILFFAYEWIWDPEGRQEGEPKPGLFLRLFYCGLPSVPFALLAVPYLAVRSHALHGVAHLMIVLSWATIIYTWPQNLCFYAWHFLYPLGLSVFYDIPIIYHATLTNFILPLAGVLAVAGLLWAWWRAAAKTDPNESRAVRFACAWLIVPILPLLDIMYLPYGEGVHDRYLYLPSVGFALLVALGLRHIRIGSMKAFGRPVAHIAAALILSLLLGVATVSQASYWYDDYVLFSRGIRIAPHNAQALDYMASVLGTLGQYRQALPLFYLEMKLRPENWIGNYNLGYTYYCMGDLKKAEICFRSSITTEMGQVNSDAFFYLGLTFMKEGKVAPAIAAFRRAVDLQPEGFAYHLALGLALKAQGDLDGALKQFELEARNYPQEAAAQQQAELILGQGRAK